MQEPYFSELDNYEVLALLGKGSSSEVYLVKERLTGKHFAMKVSEDTALLGKESALLQQVSEAIRVPGERHVSGGMQVPGGEQVFGSRFPRWKSFFQADKAYLIMEYIEGITLQAYLDRFGAVQPRLAKGIMKEILEALSQLHNRQPPVIYRDLKPENIMIEKNGRIRLVDLGAAAATNYRAGSYGYASPEQFWEGSKIGPESDLYAAGKILAFLLTGKDPCQPPYDMLQYSEKDKRISAEVYRILQRSLAADRMGRYESVEMFQKELEEAVKDNKRRKWKRAQKKQKIAYEKCVWKSEYQRTS